MKIEEETPLASHKKDHDVKIKIEEHAENCIKKEVDSVKKNESIKSISAQDQTKLSNLEEYPGLPLNIFKESEDEKDM